MTRIALTAAAVLSLVGAANAADLRAPVYKAPSLAPVDNWSGFYLGANAGIGVGRNDSSLAIPVPGGFPTFTQAPLGAIGGVQAGYNWQFGNWVLGVEADIQASGMQDEACVLNCQTFAASARFKQNLDWFGTVRGRVGYAMGSVLAYYTGGFAYGSVDTTINETLAGTPGAFSFNQTRTGWTLGSGVEVGLGGNWTGKLEYLYIDLGSQDGAYTHLGFGHTYSSDISSHIFRAGVNYRIGGANMLAPVPSANWTGFYVGANLGSGVGHNESSSAIPLAFVTETFTLAPSGLLGGGQIGYNWHAAPNWVFGIEADFQGSAQKDDQGCFISCTTAPQSLRVDQTTPWFGTLRGRIGYVAGPAMLYLTGGLAYGKVETAITEVLGGATGAFSFDETKAGWTVGGGIERSFDLFGLFGPNWTAKAEYLYVDLGSVSHAYTLAGAGHVFTTDVTSHIFRTGLNYHFNAGPVFAKY